MSKIPQECREAIQLQRCGEGDVARDRGRRVPCAPRSERLRQDHNPSHDRGLHRSQRRQDFLRGSGRHRSSREPAQRRHGVPGVCVIPAYDRGAERRLRSGNAPRSESGDQGTGRQGSQSRAARRVRRADAASAFRWPAATRCAGARTGHQPSCAVAGRAAVGAGRQAAARSEAADTAVAAVARSHDDFRDP